MAATPAFFALHKLRGFDAAATPPWQMVPRGYSREVGLKHAAGLTLASSNAAVATASFAAHNPAELQRAGSRKVIVQGLKKGKAFIEARQGAVALCKLEVSVKESKTVKITFNFVEDKAGHKTTRALASADNLLKTMNSIYTPQTFIHIVKRAARWVKIPKNLGATVDTPSAPGPEWKAVIAKRDPAAHWNVFFVRRFDVSDRPGDEDAGNAGGNCLFEDEAGVEVGETLAHELGHYLGVADFYGAAEADWLMYGYTDVRGRTIPKDHANRMNP